MAESQSRPAISRPRAITRRRLTWGQIGSYAVLLLFAAIYLGPLLMLLNTSLRPLRAFMRDAGAITTTFHWENYVEAWEKANFPQYLGNSVLYTSVSTLIFVVTAVFVSFPLARNYIKGSNALFTLFVIALFLPPGLIPLFQLILRAGLYNTQPGYMLLFLINPIGIIILVNYIRTIPKDLDEAAALDGCGYLRFVLQIVFPLIKPAIATIVVLHAIGIWNDLILATIFLTNKDYYPVTRGLIVFNGIYGNNWPVIAAATLILAIPIIILYLFLQRYFVGGYTAGSVKS